MVHGERFMVTRIALMTRIKSVPQKTRKAQKESEHGLHGSNEYTGSAR